MNKLLSLITSLLLIIFFAFCGVCCKDNASNENLLKSSSFSSSSQSTVSSESTCAHIWKSANCTTPKTCSICGKTSGTSLGHTTTTGVCSRCNEDFGAWAKKFYVDQFGLPTETPYIINKSYLVGTFSNSVTTDSKLYAYFLIDAESIAIKLFEYGSQEVKAYSSTDYKIIILDDEDNKYYIWGEMWKNGDRVHINETYESTVLDLFKTKTSLTFYLEQSEILLSTYLFSVETSNFSEIYNTL